VDEDAIRGLPARRLAETLAERKARDVRSSARRGEIVLGADTVVACGRRTIGKPSSRAEALAILRFLRGRRHRVITGLCLLDTRTGRCCVRSAVTLLRMRRVPDAAIRAYVRTGESFGKAGAYAVQETGDRFLEILRGSFSNVVGLPMELLAQMLRRIKAAPRRKR
jgi:septum formation protein